jgi:hypothetical protein
MNLNLAKLYWQPVYDRNQAGQVAITAFTARAWICPVCADKLLGRNSSGTFGANLGWRSKGGDEADGCCWTCGQPVGWAVEVWLTVQTA